MLKNKYGPDMVVADKDALDEILENTIKRFGSDYGVVLETVCDTIDIGDYSRALKSNAMHKTSWFRKYIQSYLEVK